MMKRKRLIAILLCVVSLCLIVVGCGKKSEGRVVTINNNRVTFAEAVTEVMYQRGLLEKYMPEDVTLEYTYLTSGADMRDALMAGSIEITALSVMALITNVQNGLPISLLSFAGCGPVQVYSADENIQSLADIGSSDKITVSSFGSGPHTAFLLALDKELGDAGKLTNQMVAMPNADAAAALAANTVGVDVSILTFPVLMRAEAAENVHLVYSCNDLVKEYGVGSVYCVENSYMEENPDICEAFLKAQKEALELLETDKDVWVDILSELYGADKQVISDYLDALTPTIEPFGFDKHAEFLSRVGMIEGEVPTYATFPKFVPAN